MAIILGIDLGTSSIKAMLLDSEQGAVAVESVCHDVEIPDEGYAEQTTETWWSGLREALTILKKTYSKEFDNIAAIGFSGQMHGLVAVDRNGRSLRPAILWLDQRSKDQLKEIDERFDLKRMGEIFGNRVFTGFAFPSLLWIREKEPEIYRQIDKIMMPKDFLRFRMTGKIATEASDASSTAIFNVRDRDWAYDVIRHFGLKPSMFPVCHESTEVAGYVTENCARELGLRAGIPVVYGSGDQQAQSIGNGVCRPGKIISNIGTGGQIAAYISKPVYDPHLRTQTFCHAVHKAYTIYGACLTSGMSQKWLKNNILSGFSYEQMNEMAEEVAPGCDGLIYLPYLSGERTPHMNPNAKGVFFGLSLKQDRKFLSRAVLEGVTFSLKDSLSIFDELGITGDTVIASGGGAQSDLWLQMQADVFERRVKVCQVHEQACMGACIIAGVGCGIFSDCEEAVRKLVTFRDKVFCPDESRLEVYRSQYKKFKQLYQRTCDLM